LVDLFSIRIGECLLDMAQSRMFLRHRCGVNRPRLA
jgi:hypothetical protein